MCIIKWFIETTKQLVQACKDWKSRREIEKWYFENEVTDEQLRQEAEENEREYQRQCKEEDARLNKQMEDIVEDQRTERQIEEWSMREEWEKRFDNEKDERNDYPTDVDETTLINRQNAAVDEEDVNHPSTYWIEQANERCPHCGGYVNECICDME